MEKKRIGVLLGSLRRESYTRKLALVVMKMMPARYPMCLAEIGDLPLFNQDLDDDGQTPQGWLRLREEIKAMDGYLFVTPEYNRSVPPVLKNALDIASRPPKENAWGGKPGAIISVSPGKIGAFGANHHLRQSLSFLDVYAMQQPEAYIGGAADLFDAQGAIKSESARAFLQQFADAFAAWLDRF